MTKNSGTGCRFFYAAFISNRTKADRAVEFYAEYSSVADHLKDENLPIRRPACPPAAHHKYHLLDDHPQINMPQDLH